MNNAERKQAVDQIGESARIAIQTLLAPKGVDNCSALDSAIAVAVGKGIIGTTNEIRENLPMLVIMSLISGGEMPDADRIAIDAMERLAVGALATYAASVKAIDGVNARPEIVAFVRGYAERKGADLTALAKIGIEW